MPSLTTSLDTHFVVMWGYINTAYILAINAVQSRAK